MLTKRTNGAAGGPRLSKAIVGVAGGAIDRRAFLKRSGLAAGGIAAASIPLGMVKKAEAASATTGNVEIIKSVCTHCAVGCTVRIGRASCRARVCPGRVELGGGRVFKKKNSNIKIT